MQFALSPTATWTWEKCLNFCNRIGKDVCVSFKKSSVTFICTNATNNCYILLCFGSQFFEQVNGDENNSTVIKGIIPLFFMLKSFRNLRNFQLKKTTVTVNQNEEIFKITLYSKHGVTRTHTFRFHCGKIQSPLPVSWNHRHFLISTPSQLKLILEQFRGPPLSRTTVKIPMSSNPLTSSHESSVLSFATEDIVFHYDKQMDRISIQTYKEHFCTSPKALSPVFRDEAIAEDRTQTKEFRLHHSSKHSCTMLTKALLPRTFFETLYIDTYLDDLAPNESICFDSDPLQCLCDLGENLSSQLCLTWHRAGEPLITTLGDNFAIGNSNLLFNNENPQASCFNSFESIQEVERNEKKLSLFHWTGVLWINTTLDICKAGVTQITEQRLDTIPITAPQCTENEKCITLPFVESQTCKHTSKNSKPSSFHTTHFDPSIYEPILDPSIDHVTTLSNNFNSLKDGLSASIHTVEKPSSISQKTDSHKQPRKPSLCISEDTFMDLIELECLPDSIYPKELNCGGNESDPNIRLNDICYDSCDRESQSLGNFITPKPTHTVKDIFSESEKNPFSWNKTSFDTFADAFTMTDSSATIQTASYNLHSFEKHVVASDGSQPNTNSLKKKLSRRLACDFDNASQKKICAVVSEHLSSTLQNNSSNKQNDADQWFDELDLW